MSNETVDNFYVFKVGPMWRYFKKQHFSFWMICGYLFFEFVKPQALFPAIDFLPWAQLLLLGAMIGVFIDPSIKWVSAAPNLYITAFFITILMSIVLARYPEVSKFHFMDFFGWFVIYFLTINIVNTRERLYIYILIYMVAAGKIAIGTSRSWVSRGFSFQSWGLMGPTGYFQNSGELAILMVMLFPLAFYFYQAVKNNVSTWERWLLMAFWVCPILTILGASSRGAQLAFLIQLTIMFRKSVFKIKPLIALTFFLVAFIFLLPQEQKDRFNSAGDDKSSQQRLLYWEHGWEMMKDYPLTGVGYFNFIPYYEDFYYYDKLYENAQLPHNIFIQVGTDAGFIALAFFILVILYCIWKPLRMVAMKDVDPMNKAIFAGLGIGVVGYLVAGQFVTVTYYPFIWVHLAFIVALANIEKKRWSNAN